MLGFLRRRLAAAAVMVAIASTLVFYSIQLLPGDPVALLLGEQGASSPEVVARIRAKLKLDRPLPLQYLEWVKGLAHGDLGESLESGVPVAEELARRVPRSLELIAAGLVVAALLGVPLGVVAARRPESPSGWASSAVAALAFASPVFVTGILLVIASSLWLGWLPSSGYVPPGDDLAAHLWHAVLPSLTLGLGFVGVVIRMTRASLLDNLAKDYVRTARAKGLTETQVLYRHALANSLVPVVAVLGVRAGNLLGGTVIIEALFNWPGLSSLLVQASYGRDYPMIQGCLLAVFLLFVGISLAVDLCQAALDPRVRHA